MRRLLVFWTRPGHLSVNEAETWAREELRAVASLDTVERVELSRLASASERHPRTCDWMLELDLLGASAVLDVPLLEDWVRDLRLLGMRPSMVLVDATLPLGAGNA